MSLDEGNTEVQVEIFKKCKSKYKNFCVVSCHVILCAFQLFKLYVFWWGMRKQNINPGLPITTEQLIYCTQFFVFKRLQKQSPEGKNFAHKYGALFSYDRLSPSMHVL